MKRVMTAAAAALLLFSLSGAAMAQQGDPAKANTADPNSAPGVKTMKAKKPAKDNAAKANTADPNSAPGAKPMKAKKRTAKDSAAKANTADPNSTPAK